MPMAPISLHVFYALHWFLNPTQLILLNTNAPLIVLSIEHLDVLFHYGKLGSYSQIIMIFTQNVNIISAKKELEVLPMQTPSCFMIQL